MEEIRSLLWLVMVLGAGNPQIWTLLHRYETPEAACAALKRPDAAEELHLPAHVWRRVRDTGEAQVEEMLERCSRLQISLLWYGDAAYPEALLSIVNPPVILFYQGNRE